MGRDREVQVRNGGIFISFPGTNGRAEWARISIETGDSIKQLAEDKLT